MKKKSIRLSGGISWSFDSVLETLWLFLVFALPLLFFPNLFTTFELTKITVFKGVTVLLMLAWIMKYFLKGESPVFPITKHRVLWTTLGIFSGCSLVAALFSVAPALSFFGWYPRFQGLFTFFFYAVFAGIVFFELRASEQRERLFFALTAGLALVCAAALLQKFTPGFLQLWNDSEFRDRSYGTMANPNYLAGYIVMILPLLLANIFRKKYALFSGLVLTAGLATLLFTQSRAGLLAMAAGLLFFFSFAAYARKARKTLFVLAAMPLVILGFVWSVAANSQEPWVKNNPLLQRLTLSEENISSARTRLEMWPAILRQIGASPVIGFGPETFAVSFPSYAPDTVNTREDQGEIPDRAHNELLDLAVQIGIPGTLAYAVFILGLVFAAGKNFLQRKEGGWPVLALGAGILALFTANQFGFSVTVHWVLLVLFAAVILNVMGQKDFGFVRFKLHRFAKAAMFSVIVFSSIVMFWMHDLGKIMADIEMRQGYESLAFAEFSGTAAAYGKAAELSPTEPFYAMNFAYVQLQRLFEGQELSSQETMRAYTSALHASRLRGYDGFSLSLALEIKKISGLTF